MSNFKNILLDIYKQTGFPAKQSQFDHKTSSEVENHLYRARYGTFCLTEAIRPGCDLNVVPTQGFRHDTFRGAGKPLSAVTASVSQERLFDTFFNLLDPLGDTVDVILESSHDVPELKNSGELYRDSIDLPVLKSILLQYEDLLLNDGCTGIAVMNPHLRAEVQFDEHKLLVVYARKLTPFECVFIDNYVDCNERMQILTEAEHVHCSSNRYAEQFIQLKYDLGIE